MTRHHRRLLLASIVLLILAAGAFLYWLFDGIASIDAVEARVAAFGVWAPVGFVLLYGIATIAGVPGGIFDVAGGALFGPVTGSLVNLAGGTLGAVLAFLVARYLAADWVRQRAGPRVQKVMRNVERDGWQFVAFVRLVPVLPYTIVNYLLGLTRIPFWHYVLATIVFMSPSTVAYTWIGHAGKQALSGDTNNIRYALAMLAVIALVIFAPQFYKRWRKGDDMRDDDPAAAA
ncbi:MAG: TVP38/TMEM64 family protein [Proteobacteria bacterium]|nr:TVP38/TMEM64 family protein [Pseudomonadota bacterium]